MIYKKTEQNINEITSAGIKYSCDSVTLKQNSMYVVIDCVGFILLVPTLYYSIIVLRHYDNARLWL